MNKPLTANIDCCKCESLESRLNDAIAQRDEAREERGEWIVNYKQAEIEKERLKAALITILDPLILIDEMNEWPPDEK